MKCRLRGLAGRRAPVAAVCAMAAGLAAAQAGSVDADALKARFAHEVAFRAAAIHVAWGAEALCDHVTEIEPFVLWSVHAARRSLSAAELEQLRLATGMDGRWRVAWLDEAAPDGLNLGDVVTAVNDRPLPGGNTRFDPTAVFSGNSPLANDDQGFWDVLLKAREQAAEGVAMHITLADGRRLAVDTQTGCAGSVTASAFDSRPDEFWRLGNQRARIPANAMLEANSRDEFLWLAAFGTYFQASRAAIGGVRQNESLGTAFTIGKVLALALPGGNLLLSSVEALTQRTLEVDRVVGGADLFANEVVAALGGDPAAGLRLNQRLGARGLKVDALLMSDFRRSSSAEHVRQLTLLRAAQAAAEAVADKAEDEGAARPNLEVRALPVR